MQVSKLVCKYVEVTKFTGLLGSGYEMAVGNYQCNTANLNHGKNQFQLELSLAQFSPSLSLFFTPYPLSLMAYFTKTPSKSVLWW